jgi:hypothetical protein
LSNTIGVPGVIDAQGSVAGPVTVTAMTSLTGFHGGLGVEGDGGLDVPLALAAGADVLLGAAELELGAAGHQ